MTDVVDVKRDGRSSAELPQELDLGLPPRTPAARRTPQRSEAFTSVAEFHRLFGLLVAARPGGVIDPVLAKLRVDLLVEEVEEFREASVRGDTVGVADALADIVYVAYGAALSYGIDLDAVIREVHRSNLSKLGPDGHPLRRADGKILKPSTYRSPDVRGVLLDQPPLFMDEQPGYPVQM